MEISENMYYGMGQIALAMAMADGHVDSKEAIALEKRIDKINTESAYDLSMVATTFKQQKKDNTFTSSELLKEGIRNFHLGDAHLTAELADLFLQIIIDLATAEWPIVPEEKEIATEFIDFLKKRKRQVEQRRKGYLKTVLIPIDFGTEAGGLLQKVHELEGLLKSGFRLILLHCISPESCESSNFVDEKEKALVLAKELLATHLSDKVEKNLVRVDVLNERIEYIDQKYLNENEVDLVVMATGGKDDDDYIHTTVTSEHVQRHFANYLILPQNVEIKPLNKVLLSTDYNFSTLDQFEPIRELVNKNEAKISLLHIQKDGETTDRQLRKQEDLKTYFGGAIGEIISLPVQDKVYMDIANYAAENGYDLLVALPMHTKYFAAFEGHQSVVKKLCQQTSIPLFVLNNQTKNSALENLVLEVL